MWVIVKMNKIDTLKEKDKKYFSYLYKIKTNIIPANKQNSSIKVTF